MNLFNEAEVESLSSAVAQWKSSFLIWIVLLLQKKLVKNL